ncbi:MAG: hypothetical protein KC543_10525 [Myxococcales bacterium]|nr:hypothetical protein [Myxococcales bacterium]
MTETDMLTEAGLSTERGAVPLLGVRIDAKVRDAAAEVCVRRRYVSLLRAA